MKVFEGHGPSSIFAILVTVSKILIIIINLLRSQEGGKKS